MFRPARPPGTVSPISATRCEPYGRVFASDTTWTVVRGQSSSQATEQQGRELASADPQTRGACNDARLRRGAAPGYYQRDVQSLPPAAAPACVGELPPDNARAIPAVAIDRLSGANSLKGDSSRRSPRRATCLPHVAALNVPMPTCVVSRRRGW